MSHRGTVVFTEPMLRRAVFAFWRRSVGIRSFIGVLAVLAVVTGHLVWSGDRTWLVGSCAAVFVIGLWMAVAVHRIHLRGTLARFRAMNTPQAEYAFDEQSFTFTTDAGSATHQWSAIVEVWRFADFWLPLYSKAQFSTLPLENVSAEAQAFLLERVERSGGKTDRVDS